MEPLDALWEPKGDISTGPYMADPVRQRAAGAINTREGKPIVDIRCAGSVQGWTCGRHLGGVWETSYGTVVIVNRLNKDESVAQYQRYAQQPKLRFEMEREGHGFVEMPAFLQVEGDWYPVPGASEEDAWVRCPRAGHGRWPLDLASLRQRVHLAVVTRRNLQYPTLPKT